MNLIRQYQRILSSTEGRIVTDLEVAAFLLEYEDHLDQNEYELVRQVEQEWLENHE